MSKCPFADSSIALIKQVLTTTDNMQFVKGQFNVLNSTVELTHRSVVIQIMYKQSAKIDQDRVFAWLRSLHNLLPIGTRIHSWEVFQPTGKLSRPNVVVRLTQSIDSPTDTSPAVGR